VPVFLVAVLLLCLPLASAAEQFTGKVVGIADGDTINVLREGKAVKVRLHGVDTPEKAQAFGTQARQFTSELAFQQTVTVIVQTTDQYGRLVGDVLLPDGRSLNQELVKAGMAWWYRPYAPKDTLLAQLEAEARSAQRGLWADAHPVPPWQWRKGKRQPVQTSAPLAAVPPPQDGPIVGNQKSHVYHWPGCPAYGKVSAQHRVEFPSRDAAEAAGYHAARNCR
jgi:endonuclease YncB( thermonuclease family)